MLNYYLYFISIFTQAVMYSQKLMEIKTLNLFTFFSTCSCYFLFFLTCHDVHTTYSYCHKMAFIDPMLQFYSSFLAFLWINWLTKGRFDTIWCIITHTIALILDHFAFHNAAKHNLLEKANSPMLLKIW